MAPHRVFKYKSKEDLLSAANDLGFGLPYSESVAKLLEPLEREGIYLPNRLAVQPMEGFDADPDGSPGELTFRRYKRYAEGGSGLIWFEATSVVEEGKSNPRQLFLNDKSLDGFKRLVDLTRNQSHIAFGESHRPYLVLQLTHSGRYSKPKGEPEPIICCDNKYLKTNTKNEKVITDDELIRLEDTIAETSKLAYQAGFDAVDLKACHGYLAHELLFSYNRENSIYGGENLKNRSRFLLNTVNKTKQLVPEIDRVVRLNLYDGLPYPYGFGVSKSDNSCMELTEPFELVTELIASGVKMINGTLGIPRVNPHVGRPHDVALKGVKLPDEDPVKGVGRILSVVGSLQHAFPELIVVGTGYSWLRHLSVHVGAAAIDKGYASVIGLGRNSFAYPDAVKDLINYGKLDIKKTCISCSRCTELMKHNLITGCAIRDKEIYAKEYSKIKFDE